MKRHFSRRILSTVLAVILSVGSFAVTASARGAAGEELSVTVSVEAATIGQGILVEPVTYTLSEINSLLSGRGIDAYTEDSLTPAGVLVAMFIDKGIEWQSAGDMTSFYLQAIKGIDRGYIDIPAVITENGGPTNGNNDGNSDEWLGGLDYSSSSGWMITVDHYMPNVGAGSYTAAEAAAEGHTFGDGSVIRCNFSLYGYGNDLGYDLGWCEPYFEGADKDELHREYARLSAEGFFDKNTDARNAALLVMGKLCATQTEVDAAVSSLRNAEASTAVRAEADAVLANVLAYIASAYPEPSFGTGEWAVMTLARGGFFAKDSEYFSAYCDRITQSVNEAAATVDKNGALNASRSTDNSRLIMALSSMGRDAGRVGNWDLTAPYSDFSWVTKQGLNGAAYALLALDTNNYEIGDAAVRRQCVDYILSKQLEDGGWAFFGSTSDPDMTAVALQALAPYTSDSTVNAACDKAFETLSRMQKSDGTFEAWGTAASESAAQIAVACTAHGIDPATDARFVKSGGTLLSALLGFYDKSSGMFCHTSKDGGNAMATVQCAYALVAYKRLVSGQNSLYRMTDAFETVDNGTLTAYLALPEKLGAAVNTSFNAEICVSGWNNDGAYKLADCIVNVPDCLDVTGVAASAQLSGGTLAYNLERSTGKLRIVYFDAVGGSDLILSGGATRCSLFTVSFKLNRTADVTETPEITVAVSGLSVKLSSDSFDESSVIIADITKAFGTVSLVDGIAYSAVCLYRGDGIDLIPTDKKAMAVFVASLESAAALTYDDGEYTAEFLYSSEISEKTGLCSYVAIVDASVENEQFQKAENYTCNTAKSPDTIGFGDINRDGTVNAQDALYEVDFWLRKSGEPSRREILALNVNCDSRINTFDALGIVEAFVDGSDFAVVIRAAGLASN